MGYRPTLLLRTSFVAIGVLVFAQSCRRHDGATTQTKIIEPTYNKKSGRLELLKYDSDGDGKFDTFSYMDGSTTLRVEIDRDEDGKVDRWEYFDANGSLVRAEEDTDHDGTIDKWETYDGNRLASVAFDEGRRGKPTRRILYSADGAVRVEVDASGDGHFVEQPSVQPATRHSP